MKFAFFNARYYDPKKPDRKQQKPAEGLRYIATRKGAHVISNEEAHRMETERVLQYIARRRGVYRENGESDGLFNAHGKADLEYETNQATCSRAIMWRCVLSLKKKDAERLGYTNVDAFRQLLNRHMREIAQEFNITPENLVWNAAYHPIDKRGRDNHPHIHIYMNSTDPTEGSMSPERTVKALEKARSIFTNDIFHDDLAVIKSRHTRARDELKQALTDIRTDTDAALWSGLDIDLRRLMRDLPEKGRKVSYAYLPPELKERVDAIVQKMVALPGVNAAFEEYKDSFREQVKIYNSDSYAIESRMLKWESDFFHPTGKDTRFHNVVIRTARDMSTIEKQVSMQEAALAHKNLGEIKRFVGVSADRAIQNAQTNVGYRQWLQELVNEFGSQELPVLLKSAQRENWREIHREVQRAFTENPDLCDRVTNECRVYLTAAEQTTGFLMQDDVPWCSPAITTETEDVVNAETQRILFRFRNASEDAATYIRHTIYESALDRRVKQWFRSHPDVCKKLRQAIGAVHYRVDNIHTPCPKKIADAAYVAMSDLLIRLGNEDPVLRQERNFLMMRMVKNSGDFIGVDRILNGALETAYRQELNAVFTELLYSRSENAALFDMVKHQTDASGTLPLDIQDDVAATIHRIANRSIDKKGVYSLTVHLAKMLYAERIGEQTAKQFPREFAILKERVGVRWDVDQLMQEKDILDALKIFRERTEEIPQKRMGRVLLRQAYAENWVAFEQRIRNDLRENSIAIATLAQEIPCNTAPADLTSDQLHRVGLVCSGIPQTEEAQMVYEQLVFGVIEEQRLSQILDIPYAAYVPAQKIIQMRQNIEALLQDPRVVDALQPAVRIARNNPEIADVSDECLHRVLIERVCRKQRRDFTAALFTPEHKKLFRREAKNIFIGQSFSEMSSSTRGNMQKLITDLTDNSGREFMMHEIERRLYNERFSTIAEDRNVRNQLRLYVADPHVQSIIKAVWSSISFPWQIAMQLW